MAEEMNLNEIGQETHGYSSRGYVAPTDPLLQERLEWFQDQKLALMIHFGTYSQLGIIESWALVDEDASWSRAQVDWETDPEAFRRQYWDLNKSFNPIRFQPDVWAQTAQDCGFKYLIFTTKHHDGFCMYDSAYTDYKLTGPDCPYRTNQNADLCRPLFDAFRARGMGIAAYFSKADWHVPSYWEKDKPRFTTRNPSYIPSEKPELWEGFVQFVHN
jgi:alpha-L-fucosidase